MMNIGIGASHAVGVFDRTSITSCLSSAFHFRFLASLRTTDLIYFSMSSICPFSSCKETERKAKGPRRALMSVSGRLVTHMRRFGTCESMSCTISSRTFSRGDGIAVVFGHSSNASIIKKTGA
jgi:hypothetical protein